METVELEVEEQKQKDILFVREQGTIIDKFEEKVFSEYFGQYNYRYELHTNIRPKLNHYQNFIFVGHFLHFEKDGKLFFYGKNGTDELYAIIYNDNSEIRYKFEQINKDNKLYENVLDAIIYRKTPCWFCYEFNTNCFVQK